MWSKPLLPSSTSAGSKGLGLQWLFDMGVSAVGLLALMPLFAIVSALVKWSSPGPVFHRAYRVGQGGRTFQLLKFRTMVVDAAQRGPGITTAGDERITPLGRWLRRTKIDEMPQLINVLRGEMSLVGPRPEDPRYVAYYTSEQQRVLAVLPGVTSLASIRYRREEQLLTGSDWETQYLTRILPDKLQLELDYLQRRTLISDFGVILSTLFTFLR